MGVTAPRWVWVVWGLVGVGVLISTAPFWLMVAYAALSVVATVISLVFSPPAVYVVVPGLLLWVIVGLWRR
jgi:hypothetical protein